METIGHARRVIIQAGLAIAAARKDREAQQP
jgi:hypothetical protein